MIKLGGSVRSRCNGFFLLDFHSFSFKAYAYFEHITLPRKISGAGTASHTMKRADPGENQVSTELYSFLRTPARTFIEWGVGIDQYFITLRIMAVILFFAGLIHLPNLIFYRSDEYSPLTKTGISSWSLQGSAVCETFEWVACTDCRLGRGRVRPDGQRFGFALHPTTGLNTTLVERFDCDVAFLSQGTYNWACMIFLVVSMLLMHMYLSAREVRLDEDK